MRPTRPAPLARQVAPRRVEAADSRLPHPSALDFANGVDVTEVLGTLPAELRDLFPELGRLDEKR
jgi:hypothetical protein